MGLIISRIAKLFFPKSKVRILMVGLDASGKTTILYKLKLGETVTTTPTIGVSMLRQWSIRTLASRYGMSEGNRRLGHCGGITSTMFRGWCLWWTAMTGSESQKRGTNFTGF
ncbi:unnamed protein product [Linum tenue]|uniref:ADP-ribosylation factor n=1 Tax=Linum tenue TaxID=586396 RepID=A0AAV0MI45_9ROSI|nr:unnamed protein product [Linum tenue]